MGTIAATIAAMLLGGTVATFTVVGVVNSQTAGPDQSPASVDTPAEQQIEYGSNN